MEQKTNGVSNDKITIEQETSKEPKGFLMDKSSLLIIVLLFMFSSKLWDIAWDIGKSLLYIIIILYLLSYINQDLADNIKNFIHDLTNIKSNNHFLTDLLAKLSKKISELLNIQVKTEEKIQKVVTEDEKTIEGFGSKTHTSFYEGTGDISSSNTKNLSNISRSDSKNFFN